MSAEPEAYVLQQGLWVPRPTPVGRRWWQQLGLLPCWTGEAWVVGPQYTSEESVETWAAGLDAVLGPEEGER